MSFFKKIRKEFLANKVEKKIRSNAASTYLKKEKDNPGSFYSTNAFDFYKFIFVYIPKTVGVSVAKALFGNYADGHTTIKNYQKKFPVRTFSKYYKFTFVRDPYDRLYSAYSFLKNGGMSDEDKGWAEKNLKEFNSFEEFVIKWVNKENVYSRTHFKPQFEFVINTEGEVNVDFIGRVESIDKDFKTVCGKIGVDVELKKMNSSFNSQVYSNYFSSSYD